MQHTTVFGNALLLCCSPVVTCVRKLILRASDELCFFAVRLLSSTSWYQYVAGNCCLGSFSPSGWLFVGLHLSCLDRLVPANKRVHKRPWSCHISILICQVSTACPIASRQQIALLGAQPMAAPMAKSQLGPQHPPILISIHLN